MKLYRSQKAERNILRTYDALLRQWDVAVTETDIPTSYGTTHIVCCGNAENPPLVLFHGVGDDAALMWLYNAKALSEHFCVYALDTLGGPGKSRPNAQYDRAFDTLRWIDETLAGLHLRQVYAAGVSNGAYLTQLFGLHRPEQVLRMVCMAGTVPARTGSPMKTMMKIFLPEALFPTRHNTAKLIRKLCGSHSAVFTENPLVMEHYRWLLKGFRPMAMGSHKPHRFNETEITAIREKTLYLMGDADPFAILGGKALLLNFQMHAKFFPNVGHGINHEIAETVNQEIITYLLQS